MSDVIRTQIVHEQLFVKKSNYRKWSSCSSQFLSVDNDNTKNAGAISLSHLRGGPRSEERCGLIVKMIRDHGTFHESSGSIRMRITELQQVYAGMLRKLPLWGSTKTEKEYADDMGSPEYAKYWQISSEKIQKPCSHDDEFVYFIDVAPEFQETNISEPEIHQNSLPSSINKSQLPCDRLPETRADLIARRRKEADINVYSKSELHQWNNTKEEPTQTVASIRTSPPSKMRRNKFSPSVSKNNSVLSQAREIIEKSPKEAETTELVRTTSLVSRTAVDADLEWFREAPSVVDLSQRNYISGTPMFFLPPASVLFGLRNGNDDSERIGAINQILQRYYITNEWIVVECKPGVPCVARCFDGEGFSYVRAVIVEVLQSCFRLRILYVKANDNGTWKCVCMDIMAHICIKAADISSLPGCFSVNALPPSLFVARIRGISTMNAECENKLQNLVHGYFNDAEDDMARSLPSAVFGRIGLGCIVDWIEPSCRQWISSILLEQPGVCGTRDDMASPSIDEAVMAVQEMEEKGDFKFYGLEFTADASELFNKSSMSINEKLSTIAADCCGLNGNPSINNAMDVLSVEPMQIDLISKHVTHETDRGHKLEDTTGSDNSASFHSLFKNICSSGNSTYKDLFVANSLAFAAHARIIMSTENWVPVLTEINKHT